MCTYVEYENDVGEDYRDATRLCVYLYPPIYLNVQVRDAYTWKWAAVTFTWMQRLDTLRGNNFADQTVHVYRRYAKTGLHRFFRAAISNKHLGLRSYGDEEIPRIRLKC